MCINKKDKCVKNEREREARVSEREREREQERKTKGPPSQRELCDSKFECTKHQDTIKVAGNKEIKLFWTVAVAQLADIDNCEVHSQRIELLSRRRRTTGSAL